MAQYIESFENRGLKKMRDNIKVFGLSKSKGNMPWFEKSGGSKNRGFQKSEFHCKSEVTIDSTGSRKDQYVKK